MARRKKVGEIGTTEMLLILGVVGVGIYFVISKSSTPSTTIIKTAAPSSSTSSAASTAAEIAAGAGVVDTLINDFSSSDS